MVSDEVNTVGTALLLAAAPAGRGRAMDAASVLPVLAAVPAGALTGTDMATVVELADPLDPQAVLTRLRTAAAAPGPLTLCLAGQLQLDRRQRLPHLALARSTPTTLRYTGLPWHWLATELAARRPGTTTVVADLAAEPELFERLAAERSALQLGPSVTLFAQVTPFPRRGAPTTPEYLRHFATVWRGGARPPLPLLHAEAAMAAEAATGVSGAILLTPEAEGGAYAVPPHPAPGAVQAPASAPAPVPAPVSASPAAVPREAVESPPTRRLGAGGRTLADRRAAPPAAAPATGPAAAPAAAVVVAGAPGGAAPAAAAAPVPAPVPARAPATARALTPAPAPAAAPVSAGPAPVPPSPGSGDDPHPAILAAAMAGRHGEAAAVAAAWESEALRRYGPRSGEAVHWVEVRADLARLAGEPARSCELWITAAQARLGLRQGPHEPDVEGAVDRAHHQWEQIRDPAKARALGPALVALRRQVPGRRAGALAALQRKLG